MTLKITRFNPTGIYEYSDTLETATLVSTMHDGCNRYSIIRGDGIATVAPSNGTLVIEASE